MCRQYFPVTRVTSQGRERARETRRETPIWKEWYENCHIHHTTQLSVRRLLRYLLMFWLWRGTLPSQQSSISRERIGVKRYRIILIPTHIRYSRRFKTHFLAARPRTSFIKLSSWIRRLSYHTDSNIIIRYPFRFKTRFLADGPSYDRSCDSFSHRNCRNKRHHAAWIKRLLSSYWFQRIKRY